MLVRVGTLVAAIENVAQVGTRIMNPRSEIPPGQGQPPADAHWRELCHVVAEKEALF
jgi:hypothetical protein